MEALLFARDFLTWRASGRYPLSRTVWGHAYPVSWLSHRDCSIRRLVLARPVQDPSRAVYDPLAYRRDIDGLRAIAVLSVMLYHFGVPGFSGGFVGVDVFFVISGFLIGGILWRELQANGRIALGRFYLRRFRRLAPAFFTMIAVVTLVAWVVLLPFEFREYGKILIAATVYLSNVQFWRDAGYFDAASDEKLLLHTWSLAVEEQFYIFLPLFLVLLARFRRSLVGLLGLIAAASFLACIALTARMPEATFFLFPFRMWELLAGVLLAIWGQAGQRDFRGHASLSWLGLLLILGAVTLIDADDAFPGALAAVPVLGTVLMVANGRNGSAVNVVLAAPVPVFVGLISYSLYLWHWPVAVLSKYLGGSYASGWEIAGWIGLSFVLAYLSWALVERPVRRSLRLPGAVILGGTVMGSAACLGAGALFYLKDGLPGRFGPAAQPHIAASADFLQDWSRCYVPDRGPLMGIEVCPIGPEGDPALLIWGDSHVRAVKEGLELAAFEADRPGMIIWMAGCPPLFDLRKSETAATPSQNVACAQQNLQVKQALRSLRSVEDILLVGRWSYYATGTGVGLDAENEILVTRIEGAVDGGVSQAEIVGEAVAATVAHLNRHVSRVAVLRQPPEIAMYDSRIAAREFAHRGLPFAQEPRTQDHITYHDLRQRAVLADAPFQALEAVGQVLWIDSWAPMCAAGTCRALVDGEGFYFDNNHLTNTAARRMRHLFHPILPPRDGVLPAPQEEAVLR
ncbi:MAG: acyltransferase [Alphaproteobacteria bacterium]|nr:acyltransferase [Alphaproteobacteria bacterium]